MKSKIDNIGIGLIFGLLAPVIAIYVFFLLSNHNMNLEEFFAHLFRYRLVSHMISIGAISNLAVFFAFIWLNYLKTARGVVFATLIFAIFVAIAKFI